MPENKKFVLRIDGGRAWSGRSAIVKTFDTREEAEAALAEYVIVNWGMEMDDIDLPDDTAQAVAEYFVDSEESYAIEEVPEAVSDLLAKAQVYRGLPNGGPVLLVAPDGRISDGFQVVAKAGSQRTAERALKSAGFVKNGPGWKLARVDKAGARA